MGLFAVIVGYMVANGLILLGFRERHKANPDQKIPHFSSPRSGEGRALAYLMFGSRIFGGATGYVGAQMPFWVVIIISVLVAIAYTVLIIRHNQPVEQQSDQRHN